MQRPAGPLTFDIQGVVGDRPTPAFSTGNPVLDNGFQQITNLFPSLNLTDLTLGASGSVAAGATYVLSGGAHQDLLEPVTNPEQAAFLKERASWLASGGSGLNPAYFAEIEDAYLVLSDPARQGGIQVGQFRVPFTYSDWDTYRPAIAVAPDESPLLESLSAGAAFPLQPSTLTWVRDIGAMLFADPGPYAYWVGFVNGSGPNRFDDNPDKDAFARFDWRSGPGQEIGVSFQGGADVAYPLGFTGPPATYGRRDWGFHLRFPLGPATISGEYLTALRIGLDNQPRRGWYLQAGGPGGVGPYAQFAESTIPDLGYRGDQLAAGWLLPLGSALTTRIEYAERWESVSGRSDSWGRYVLGLEATF